MSARFELERQVADWLGEERPAHAPAGLLEATLAEIASTPRRQAWRIVDRWTWQHAATLRTVARLAVIAATLAALVAITVVLASLFGAPRPAPPFGLANPGYISVDTADGIIGASADGSDRVVLVPPVGESRNPTWSRDGLLLAYWHRDAAPSPWSLLVIGRDGGSPTTLVEGVRLASRELELHQPSGITWSPDSRQLAYAADVAAGQAIFVATVGGVGAAMITPAAGNAIDPAWRPDGAVIAYRDIRSGTVRVVAPDGTGERQLASLPSTTLWMDWKPDGSALAVAAFVDVQSDIFTISANGEVVTNVSHNQAVELSPVWSPDGSRLAWTRGVAAGSSTAHVVVASADGGPALSIQVTADFAPPVWSPDGTRLFSYVAGSDGSFSELVVLDPGGTAPAVRIPVNDNVGNGSWQRLP